MLSADGADYQNDPDVARLHETDQIVDLREFLGVPDKIVVASCPPRVDIDRAHIYPVVEILLNHVYHALLVLVAMVQPDPVMVSPLRIGGFGQISWRNHAECNRYQVCEHEERFRHNLS